MMSIKLFLGFCCLTFTLALINLKPYDQTASVMFNMVDHDQDGDVNRNELDQAFKAYDTNGNGRISKQEYVSYVEQIIHDTSYRHLMLATFDIIDVDNDHILDHHDFDNFFSLMDSDSNNLVSLAEYVRYWSALFPDLENLGKN
ncbi:calcium-binding protein NCSA-like [Physella acuta]|uniref:calcium-binding protein NCSA-like n=1 Tax=Physella acuta TaxID=109671 RepID=UPI0027DDFB2E|nr:calcium-binding protein NCSA-like [Physella acuta]